MTDQLEVGDREAEIKWKTRSNLKNIKLRDSHWWRDWRTNFKLTDGLLYVTGIVRRYIVRYVLTVVAAMTRNFSCRQLNQPGAIFFPSQKHAGRVSRRRFSSMPTSRARKIGQADFCVTNIRGISSLGSASCTEMGACVIICASRPIPGLTAHFL
jgi:hypothetical protein